MLNLFQHPFRRRTARFNEMDPQGDGQRFFGGGATYGLNAPPGTAEATGLSNPSLLTEETPNTQSSRRTCGKLTQLRQVPSFWGTHSSPAGADSCHWLASVLR